MSSVQSETRPLNAAQEVAIALVWREDKLLIALRPKQALEGGCWEFPGGKVEPQETAEEALVRECKEELGVRVISLGLAFTSRVQRPAPQGLLLLRFFHAQLAANQSPTPLAADALSWVGVGELQALAFCSADKELIDALASGRLSPPAATKPRAV